MPASSIQHIGWSIVIIRRPQPWVVGHSLLRSMLRVTLGRERVQLCNLVFYNAGENAG